MPRRSRRTNPRLKKDNVKILTDLMNAQGEGTADPMGAKHLENLGQARQGPHGCKTTKHEVAPANVDKMISPRRKMSPKWLRKLAILFSNQQTPCGKLGASRYRKLWLTYSKRAIQICPSGCAMLRQPKPPLEQVKNRELSNLLQMRL
jgi:hypothetical protein